MPPGQFGDCRPRRAEDAPPHEIRLWQQGCAFAVDLTQEILSKEHKMTVQWFILIHSRTFSNQVHFCFYSE